MLISQGGGDPSAMPSPFLRSSDKMPGFAFLTYAWQQAELGSVLTQLSCDLLFRNDLQRQGSQSVMVLSSETGAKCCCACKGVVAALHAEQHLAPVFAVLRDEVACCGYAICTGSLSPRPYKLPAYGFA